MGNGAKGAGTVRKLEQAFHDTLDYINEHGWTRGHYEIETGECCLAGAIRRAVHDKDLRLQMRAYIHAHTKQSSVERYNDRVATCKDDVTDLLYECIMKIHYKDEDTRKVSCS